MNTKNQSDLQLLDCLDLFEEVIDDSWVEAIQEQLEDSQDENTSTQSPNSSIKNSH